MKTKQKIELDVDFIGGQEPLTDKEKKAISEFIRKSKSKKVTKRKGNTKKEIV